VSLPRQHRDLEKEVEAGRFRQDLYYRLNVHTPSCSAASRAAGDIPMLVDQLLRSLAERLRVRPKDRNTEALALLAAYDWRKNNVRELRNCLERMMIATDAACH
jgi:DNA-binding NtrC family response regulator